jgi:hypothetical protein
MRAMIPSLHVVSTWALPVWDVWFDREQPMMRTG